MSGVKHTPGPWEAKRYPEGDCWHIHFGDKGCWLGEIYIDGDDNGAASDALLIASAPDLLEALEPDFMDAVAFVLDAHNCHATAGSVRNYAIKQRAAIARARGEQDGGGHV